MKIDFKDGSYFELVPKDNGMIVVLCGIKNENQLTMSSTILDNDQIQKIAIFLEQYLNGKV